MPKSLQATLIALILLSICIVTALFSRSARSQSSTAPTAQPLQVGTYQIATSQNVVFVLDTRTAHVWGKNIADSNWTAELSLPRHSAK